MPDAGDAVRNRDARQATAVIEGKLPDAGNAVRNRDARQTLAFKEGLIPDAGDRITFNCRRNHQLARRPFITASDSDRSTFGLML